MYLTYVLLPPLPRSQARPYKKGGIVVVSLSKTGRPAGRQPSLE